MGFAAWWLNLDGVAPPPPPVSGVAVPGRMVLGTIIESYTNPYVRYLDDQRIKRLRYKKKELVFKKIQNSKQFAYLLNMKDKANGFGSVFEIIINKDSLKEKENISLFAYRLSKELNFKSLFNFRQSIDTKINKPKPIKDHNDMEILIKYTSLNRKERDLKIKDSHPSINRSSRNFDFEEFLVYKPNMKKKHWLMR